MKADKQMNKIFLMALSEPEYARVEYWINQQKESGWSETVFLRKLIDSYRYYFSVIDNEIKKLNSWGNQVFDHRLPLLYETDFELTGHVGKSELQSLLLSMNRLADKWDDHFKNKWAITETAQEPHEKIIQPIHWCKGVQSLRQFIDSLKNAGLIENRETIEIIQEHFYVDGQKPTKEPKPMKWLIESKYLAYLMHRLAEEFIINIKGKKHQLTASHFISSENKELKSLASQLSQILKYGKSSDTSISTIENIIQRVKS